MTPYAEIGELPLAAGQALGIEWQGDALDGRVWNVRDHDEQHLTGDYARDALPNLRSLSCSFYPYRRPALT